MKTIEKLKKHRIRPSILRQTILAFLMSTKAHPTAEQIYQEVYRTYPGISRTTIYNTVKAFYEKGLIRQLSIKGNELSYDADLSAHSHFYCRKCKQVIDLIHGVTDVPNKIDGNVVEESQINYKGVCKKCRKEKAC
jgi:Fur family peroxide stress response transcriptional regulator